MPRRSKNDAPPILSVNETAAQYTGEWILMKVTEYDEHQHPSRGEIIAHSPRRARISKAFAKEPPRAQIPPGTLYYIYQAYPRIKTFEEWSTLIDRLTADPAADVRW